MANDTPPGSDNLYKIRQATFSAALTVMAEADTVAGHAKRLELADRIISSPGDWPLKLAEIAEADNWGAVMTWDSVTPTQVRAAILAVWTQVALATFGRSAAA
jgi:hypothetical protein